MGKPFISTPFHKKFGQHVKKLRKEQALLQSQLSTDMDVNHSYVGFVERGERNITLQNINQLAKALKIRPKDLFDFE